ncbi:hypothetical protein ODI84_00165 [Pseudomonas putida]|uniref:hypothetical protein n=1 Tax=Pseudomonas putida TaxID=303 RepID=UPI002D1EDCA5|nr:hypothetical protein [Pseudomonas putida]MEB3898593.1 hypothetical protein [Pseudomonas putida]
MTAISGQRGEAKKVKLFQPVLISDNWYWQKAFIQITICHRIDAKETPALGQDEHLNEIPVEHFDVATVVPPPPCGQFENRFP